MNRFTAASVVDLVRGADHPLGVKELMRLCALHPGQQTALKRVLRELVKEGQLQKEGKRFRLSQSQLESQSQLSSQSESQSPPQSRRQAKSRSGRAPSQPLGARGPQVPGAVGFPRRPAAAARHVEGILRVHRDGYAFVHPLSGDAENVFVRPEDASRALDNDRVMVEVRRGRDGRPLGHIVEVTGRTRQMVVGEYHEAHGKAWVATEVGRVDVPATQLARRGDAVKVRLGVGHAVLGHSAQLTGEVAGSLGKMGDRSVEVLGIAYAQGFHEEFPPPVMDEADRVGPVVGAADAADPSRKDLRELPLVTIDGEDARDFDDAVWVADHPKGFRLVVAIADVAHYVREGTALDREALRRATSVYLPGRVLPMLPERLSNGICSLKPEEDRLCMVADLVIDRQGRTVGSELYAAVMRSAARCTYEEVQAVLDGRRVPHREQFAPMFRKLLELSGVLGHMRSERGAIDFDLPETRVELDAEGDPARMVRRERLDSHRIVEECMLAANEAVARFFRGRGLPTVNRYHAPPDEEKLEAFAALAGAHGLKVRSGALTSKELNAILKQLEGHPEQRALNQLLLRSMMQAVYSSLNDGHYGLGAEDYLHFTSPIRRYPDLLVHRLLKRVWAFHPIDSEPLEHWAVQCSERERAAMKVEREVIAFYSCLMMKDRVGQVLPATVSGLTENGFFAELDGLYIDGMVRPAAWKFEQRLHRGTLGGSKVVKVGLPLTVRVESINLKARKIDLEVVAMEGAAVKAQPPKVRRAGSEGPRSGASGRGGRAPGRPKGGRRNSARRR